MLMAGVPLLLQQGMNAKTHCGAVVLHLVYDAASHAHGQVSQCDRADGMERLFQMLVWCDMDVVALRVSCEAADAWCEQGVEGEGGEPRRRKSHRGGRKVPLALQPVSYVSALASGRVQRSALWCTPVSACSPSVQVRLGLGGREGRARTAAASQDTPCFRDAQRHSALCPYRARRTAGCAGARA